MTDKVQNYNSVSRLFHWSVALLILGLLVAGFYMEGLDPDPFKYQIYGVHKALGIAVLALAVLRIVWKHVSSSPKSLSTHKQWEKILSKTIHIVLYLSMIAMPLSGWVMSSAGGHPVSFFGLFEVPPIVGKDKELSKLASEVHEILGFAIIACVGLHIVGALKHHVIDKDETLTRMGGNLVFAVLGVLVLGAAFFIPAQNWVQALTADNAVQAETEHGSAGTGE